MPRSWIVPAFSALAAALPLHAQGVNVLSEEERLQGFELLFDGSLAGFERNFTTHRSQSQPFWEVPLDRNEWSVDGAASALSWTGFGEPVRSTRQYRDFDLRFDYRSAEWGGVVYRHLLHYGPEQIGVAFSLKDGASDNPLYTAGAAAGLITPSAEVGKDFKTGLWNQARILVVGDSVEHRLNGVKVVAYRYHDAAFWKAYEAGDWKGHPNYTFADPGVKAAGPIPEGFISFMPTRLLLRNLRVKEIAKGSPLPVREILTGPPGIGEAAEGFELLYDGTRESMARSFVTYSQGDSAGAPISEAWSVDASTGALVNLASTRDLRSIRRYGDFDLRMEYRCDANSGVFYRSTLAGDQQWQTGLEYEINDVAGGYKHSAGAVSELFGPYPNTYKPFNTGEWNILRVVARGDSVEHWMNGTRVTAFRTHSLDFRRAYSVSKWNVAHTMSYNVPNDLSAGPIREGYIGIQGDWGGRLQIRGFRIKDLSAGASISPIRTAARRPGRNARFRGLLMLPVDGAGWTDVRGRSYLPTRRIP